jgi:hypothetical protein
LVCSDLYDFSCFINFLSIISTSDRKLNRLFRSIKLENGLSLFLIYFDIPFFNKFVIGYYYFRDPNSPVFVFFYGTFIVLKSVFLPALSNSINGEGDRGHGAVD